MVIASDWLGKVVTLTHTHTSVALTTSGPSEAGSAMSFDVADVKRQSR